MGRNVAYVIIILVVILVVLLVIFLIKQAAFAPQPIIISPSPFPSETAIPLPSGETTPTPSGF